MSQCIEVIPEFDWASTTSSVATMSCGSITLRARASSAADVALSAGQVHDMILFEQVMAAIRVAASTTAPAPTT